MTEIDQAVLRLLTGRWQTASELVADLRDWTKAGIYKGPPWQPGDVLSATDRLILQGKAEGSPDGFRLMPDRPKADPQRSFL